MPKALTKRILIDIAERAHRCRSNKRHSIVRGNKRLKVIEGRAKLHYCVECAKKFLEADIKKLNDYLKELQEEIVPIINP